MTVARANAGVRGRFTTGSLLAACLLILAPCAFSAEADVSARPPAHLDCPNDCPNANARIDADSGGCCCALVALRSEDSWGDDEPTEIDASMSRVDPVLNGDVFVASPGGAVLHATSPPLYLTTLRLRI